MSANRGSELELAIARAAREYRKQGICALVKQEPRVSTINGEMAYTGSAAIDFLGCHGPAGKFTAGRALCVEAKQTGKKSFPLRDLRDDQVAALEAFHALGADVRVCVDMTEIGECYLVDFIFVSCFIAAPWRRSLSVQWLRAYGLLLPEVNRDTAQRKVLFLEGKEHPQWEQYREEVDFERETKPTIKLDDSEDDDAPRPVKPDEYAGKTPEEVREMRHASLVESIALGYERQKNKPVRTWTKGRRRAG